MNRDSSRRLLEGWKEIASYLRTSARTAQRWEEQLQLPVKRNVRVHGSTVFALADELDEWRIAHSEARSEVEGAVGQACREQQASEEAARFEPPEPEHETGPASEPCPQEPGTAAAILAARPDVVLASDIATRGSTRADGGTPGNRWLARRWTVALLAIVLALAGAAIVRFLGRSGNDPQSRSEQASVNSGAPLSGPNLAVSGQVVVLGINLGSETATVEVPNGGMATIALPSRRKLGITPLERDDGVELLLSEIVATQPGGTESVREITRLDIEPGRVMPIDIDNISVELSRTPSHRTPAEGASSERTPQKRCCVTCGSYTVCATSVRTSCGTCQATR